MCILYAILFNRYLHCLFTKRFLYISDSAVVKFATPLFWYQFKSDAVINCDDVISGAGQRRVQVDGRLAGRLHELGDERAGSDWGWMYRHEPVREVDRQHV